MADLTERRDLPRLSDYPRFVRRHIAVIAVFVLAGALFGVGWATGQPKTFSATASVALTPVPKYLAPLSPEIPPSAVTIDTDAQLLHSTEVVQAVTAALCRERDSA